MRLPGIGMRIIKSAAAVVLCLLVNLLRGEDGIVFYSQLAALWCIQMYRNNTISNALQRTVGTVVGALYGLLYILLFPMLLQFEMSLLVEAVCLFIFIVLVLYTAVLLHKNQAAYFSCVVFLSIVINHIGDGNPYFFVWNRFLDTMIGIGIGLFVNNIRICFHPDRKTLFVSGVDDILLDKEDHISDFSKVELNRMIEDGMNFTISTKRTVASLLEPMRELNFQYPVIVMDGAAIYDTKNNEYLKEYVISQDTSGRLYDLMKRNNLSVYVNMIIDDTLLIYYGESEDECNRKLWKKLKVSPLRNYIKREYDGTEKVVYFMVLDKTPIIENFYEKLVQEGYAENLKILHYPSDDYEGYSYIKIYNKNASKENMLLYLKERYGFESCLTFGTVEGKYDVMVPENNFNAMVRMVRKRYEPFGR